MISALDLKAYALQKFFNFWGKLARILLNYGAVNSVTITRDLQYGQDP